MDCLHNLSRVWVPFTLANLWTSNIHHICILKWEFLINILKHWEDQKRVSQFWSTVLGLFSGLTASISHLWLASQSTYLVMLPTNKRQTLENLKWLFFQAITLLEPRARPFDISVLAYPLSLSLYLTHTHTQTHTQTHIHVRAYTYTPLTHTNPPISLLTKCWFKSLDCSKYRIWVS